MIETEVKGQKSDGQMTLFRPAATVNQPFDL